MNRIFALIFTVIALTCIPAAAASASENAPPKWELSLRGEWNYYLGDSPDFSGKDYDHSLWEKVSLPGTLIKEVIRGTGNIEGILWLRKIVFIDKAMEGEKLGLIMGSIGNADETYFNGEKIGSLGSFPPDEHSMWNHPRHYSVPEKFINYGGNNVIAVRLSYYVFAEMLGKLALMDYENWYKDKVTGNFTRITLTYMFMAMGVLLFVIFSIFFVMRPESKEYLFYALQLVAGFFIVFELCNYWPVFPTTLFRLKVLGVSWVAVNVAHPMFLHRIYELDRKKIEIALTAYLSVMVILAVSFTDPKWVLTYGIVLIVLTTAIGFYNLSCHFTALYKKHPYTKRFSFFGISVILGAIHDGFVYFFKFTGVETSIFGYSFHNMIFHYGAAALYVGTALVLVARFMNMMEEVEDLNTNLENFIIENALLNERLKENSGIQKPQTAGTVTITDKTEEKVKQVINYVKANYSSDISREGLAASVDVHPDNLGKLFKIYTDKKLGDYINELRIIEASRKLIETDDSIINIAFSVGFESLRTFNRIFPKYMKTTPEKYRKEYKK